MAFNDARYFHHLDVSIKGNLKMLDQVACSEGAGVVKIQFAPFTQEFYFPAYFTPKAHVNILSHYVLCQYDIEPVHNKSGGHLVLPGGHQVPMMINNRVSVVNILPPPHAFVNNLLAAKESSLLWHRRTMHCSKNKLIKLGVIKKNAKFDQCTDCTACRPVISRLQLNSEYKTVAEKPGDFVSMDLLIPTKGVDGCFLVAVDFYSRFISTEFCLKTDAQSLLGALKAILNRFPHPVSTLILDRQPGFTAKQFTDYLNDEKISYRFVPPERHGEFTGIVERTMLTLKTMSRTALHSMHLDTTFWRYAVKYSGFIKNRLPHLVITLHTGFC